jgi:membrane protein
LTWLEWPARIRAFLSGKLWEIEPERRSRLSALRLLQFSIMLGEGFVRDHLLLRASALTYFTVLSVVPLLAVIVAIASAVGVGTTTFVDWVVGTVAAGAPGAEGPIRTLIEGVDFSGSGKLGGGMLFVMTVFAIGNVESTFNHIWGVASGRSWTRRFSDYLAVIVVAPLLAGLALSWVSTLRSQWAVSTLHDVALLGFVDELGGVLAPIVLLWIAFGFLYWFLPNTRVRVVSALIGGVFSAVMVAFAQSIYVDFSVGVARADVFFGGFALLPLLFAWIYVFWAIVLLGAEIAFAHQHFALYRQEVQDDPAGPAEREAIALRIAIAVAERFNAGGSAATAEGLADALRVPVRTVRAITGTLERAGILAVRLDPQHEEAFQLGRPAEAIAVLDVMEALRGRREPVPAADATGARVTKLLDRLDVATGEAVSGCTLADLLEVAEPGALVDPSAAHA